MELNVNKSMITEDLQKYKKILSVVAGGMLLLAIPSVWPYAYYQILRWVVAGTAGFNAYTVHHPKKGGLFWVMIGIVVLFNPLIPIHFVKETWIVLDLVVAVIFFVTATEKHYGETTGTKTKTR